MRRLSSPWIIAGVDSIPIDDINQRTMRSREAVRAYSRSHELQPPEESALQLVAHEVRGRPILDLGVGGGRTVGPLRQLSEDYLGVDISRPMVEAARRRHPGVRFEHADARNLSLLKDGSIFLAVFSCNGIGMVGHEDRLAILREVHRVVAPGGVFVFSTHNQRCPDHAAGFKFPSLPLSLNPARMLIRSARFARSTVRRAYNRWRFDRYSFRSSEYSIINDQCHDYATMLYYIKLGAQREQLTKIGFQPHAVAFDLAGRVANEECADSSLTLVARR